MTDQRPKDSDPPKEDPPSAPRDPGIKRIPKTRKEREHHAREMLAHLPSVTDAEWRLACSDVAEALSKHTAFKIKVIGVVGAVLLAILIPIVAYFGLTIKNDITKQLSNFREDADRKIGDVKTSFSQQIATEFKSDNIQAIIRQTAAEESKALLSRSVQPSIDSFNSKIDSRFTEFDLSLKQQLANASANLESLKIELNRLQQRNELTALADQAIGQGDVNAYRKLEGLYTTAPPGEYLNAVIAESFRVYSAYSLFSPSRSAGYTVQANKVNPKKTAEDELDADELMGIWPSINDGVGRAKIASLLAIKVKPGSFKTAEWTIDAIKKENHLEAMQHLRGVFQQITGYDKGGKLDDSDVLKWWDENKDDLKKKDTDNAANH
jgi:hypothetical protein